MAQIISRLKLSQDTQTLRHQPFPAPAISHSTGHSTDPASGLVFGKVLTARRLLP